MFLANSPSRLQQRQPRLEQASVVIRKWWSYTGEGFACQARVKQGFRGALPRACVTMSACKRTCALQGQTAAIASYCEDLQQRCSRDFGSHAIRLRNGIGLQADTPSAKHGTQRLTRIVSSFAEHCTRHAIPKTAGPIVSCRVSSVPLCNHCVQKWSTVLRPVRLHHTRRASARLLLF